MNLVALKREGGSVDEHLSLVLLVSCFCVKNGPGSLMISVCLDGGPLKDLDFGKITSVKNSCIYSFRKSMSYP